MVVDGSVALDTQPYDWGAFWLNLGGFGHPDDRALPMLVHLSRAPQLRAPVSDGTIAAVGRATGGKKGRVSRVRD